MGEWILEINFRDYMGTKNQTEKARFTALYRALLYSYTKVYKGLQHFLGPSQGSYAVL